MSEDFGEKLENSKEKLARFRQEIAEIKEAELAKRDAGKNFLSHFEDINPEELEEEDMRVYYSLKDLSQADILAYRDSLIIKYAPHTTRAVFAQWLIDQWMGFLD